MKKTFKTSPLPFRGQKRYYLKRFASVLERCKDITTVVDLFGGSGLLSRVAKDMLPNARVVYNDYDHFNRRVEMIDRTNALCAKIAPLVKGVDDNKRIPDDIKQQCLKLMREAEQTGAVDYITLSASLLFSGNWATSYEQFAKQTFYNRAVTLTMMRQAILAAWKFGTKIIGNCSQSSKTRKMCYLFSTRLICRQNAAHTKATHIGS